MNRILLAVALALGLVSTAQALEVRTIVEFHEAVPACWNIEDTFQLRVYEAQRKPALIYQYVAEVRIKTGTNTSAPACRWFYAGERRYVAEKRPTDRGGFAPATDPTNVGTGRGGAYFCMGWLVNQTNNEDHSKPCFWVHLAE